MEEIPSIGASFFVPINAFAEVSAIDAASRLFVSKAWRVPLRHLMLQVYPCKDYPHKQGAIAAARRADVVCAMLQHADVWQVNLSTAETRTGPNAGAFASLWIETRESVPGAQPFLLTDGLRTMDLDAAGGGDALVAALLDYAEAVCVSHGIVTVMEKNRVRSEVSFVGFWSGGVLAHPHPDQFQRMRAARRELGTRYVRFPRWGTIYSRAHVAQLGGVDRIREVVRPAVIRELGAEALYFQLTESVATATSDEAVAKERAFTELAAPLLPPPVLAED